METEVVLVEGARWVAGVVVDTGEGRGEVTGSVVGIVVDTGGKRGVGIECLVGVADRKVGWGERDTELVGMG